MTTKKMPIHVIFTVVYLLLVVISSMPTETASKDCLLEYNALCSFTPISTVMLLALGGLHIYLHRKALAKIEQ